MIKTVFPYTSTVNLEYIAIPPGVLVECNFDLDKRLSIIPGSDGVIEVNDKQQNDNRCKYVTLKDAGNIPTGKKFNEETGLKAGDVVNFNASYKKLIISKIDKVKEKSFLNPAVDENNRAIPPGWLVQAFIGRPDVQTFLNGGIRATRCLVDCLAYAGKNIKECESILDFGCGCGRVLRNLPDFTGARVIGCDLNADAIDWCKKHMGFGDFFLGKEKPPLPIESSSIDFLYAISVLTHLDEQHQNLWLKEWQRILKPGGIIVTTYHGEDYIEKRVAKNRADLIKNEWERNGGLFFIHGGWEGIFPDFYQTTYHTTDYVKEYWSKYFSIVKFFKSGEFANPQNAVIMEKK